MSDSFPAISADQLTKSVSLAAGGVLSALDAETADDDLENDDGSPETSSIKLERNSPQTSLKLLENLSTSVTSNLGKLNELSSYTPAVNSQPYNPRNRNTNSQKSTTNEKGSSTTHRKYSTRKNYKLLPPLIPNQVRTNLKRPGPKTGLQRQLVTLGHGANLGNSQELKSMPVRAARYTTNYLFLRTTHISSSTEGQAKNGTIATPIPLEQEANKNATNIHVTPSTLACDGGSHITQSVATISSPTIVCSIVTTSQMAVQFSPKAVSSPTGSTVSTVLSSGKGNRSLPNILPFPKFQPILQLPYSISGVQPNVLLNSAVVSKENGIIYIQSANENKLNTSCNIQVQQPDQLKRVDSQTRNVPLPVTVTQTSPIIGNTFEPSGSNVLASVKHVLTPVNGSQDETLSLAAASVTLAPRANQLATVTLRPTQADIQSTLTPQAFMVRKGSGQPSTTLLSTQIPGAVNSIMVSPGRFLLTSPSIRLIPSTSTIQPLTALHMQSPAVSSQSSQELHCAQTTSINKQETVIHGTTQNSSVVKHSLDLITPQASSRTSGTIVDPITTGSYAPTSSAELEHATILSSLSVLNLVSADKTNTSNTPIHTAFSKIVPQHVLGTKTLTDTISSSVSQSKPVAATVIAVQAGVPRNGLHHAQSVRFQTASPAASASAMLPLTTCGSGNRSSHISLNSLSGNNISAGVGEAHSSVELLPRSSASQISSQCSVVSVTGIPSSQVSIEMDGSTRSCGQKLTSAPVSSLQPSLPTEISAFSRHQQLQSSSGDSKGANSLHHQSTSQPHQLESETLQRLEDAQKARAVNIQVSANLILPRISSTSTSSLVVSPGQGSRLITSPPCCQPSSISQSEADSVDLSLQVDSSLPLSKVAAAAAMVSLSSQKVTASSPSFQNQTTASANPQNPPASAQVTTSVSKSISPTAPYLLPSSDGTRLVISPAGIKHLQSLLKKQGISEGYFIITSPRIPPGCTQPKRKIEESLLGKTSISEQSFSQTSEKDVGQESVKSLVSESDSFVESPPSVDTEGTLAPKNVEINATLTDSDTGAIKKSTENDNCQDVEMDGGESETSCSSDSCASSAALVIETGEEEERIESSRPVESPESNVSSVKSSDITKEGDGPEHNIATSEGNSSVVSSLSQQQHDSSWCSESSVADQSKQCIPQSPLSLGDLIRRQQQSRQTYTRPLDYNFLTSSLSKEKDAVSECGKKDPPECPQLPVSEHQEDFQFPMPLCPASAFGGLSQQQQQQQQHPDSEIQAGFQNSMYTSNTSFSNDLSFDSTLHHPAVENRLNQHTGDSSSNASPKMLSQAMNIASPKSPLSVNSSHTMDQSAPLNPPMTPNTMLINLLNRVPTPLLTNHQDLLSVPTSQENSAQDSVAANDFDLAQNKRNANMFSGKSMDFAGGNQTHLNGGQIGDGNLLYDDHSQTQSNNTGGFSTAQNALDMIAANYATNNSRTNALPQDTDTSQLSSNFNMMGSKSFDQVSFSHCVMDNQPPPPINYSGSYQHESDSHNPCHSYHCKSCTGPLLVTVNLDSDSSTYAPVSHPDNNAGKSPGGLLETYEQPAVYNQTLSLQSHGEERSDVSSSINAEKSGETDILRHLVLNTSSSTFHTLQPVQNLNPQHFDAPGPSFTMQQSHSESQFECRVESFLEPDDPQHKTLSEADISQGNTFPPQDESFLHLDHVHNQQSSSFDTSNTSFKNGSFPSASHQSYENTVSTSFSDENNSSMDNQGGATYIMETNMASDTTFNVQEMAKNSLPMPHDFLGSDSRLQHLTTFRADEPQNELFYQHSHPQQSALHQHHYDPSNQHPSHSLEYHLDNLPASHQAHQFPAPSLSHPDSARMYQNHGGGVSYMEGQYSSQYYDTSGVASNLPMFSQQCAVGSEAPVLGSSGGHPCNIPFSNAPTGLQLEFRFPPEDVDANNIEKQPVLPSASFSPPSVADQAATPELGGMSTYNGTFPNLSMYDMYVRGGNTDARGAHADVTPESGNFCVECNIMYKGQCKFHPCDYTYVSDTPILSHARLTVPACLKLGTSSIVGHINSTGVFAREKIPVRTKFGPLIGSPVSCDKLGSTRSFSLWQAFTGTNTKVVDTSDENSSNWLMFVKPARVSAEQNLVAFQHGSSVYFVTRMDIEPDTELLYWFAKDYSRMLGITAKPKNARHQLCPHCTICKQVFPDRKQICSHMRLQHPKPCTKKCPHCPRKFLQTSHLNVHITSVHMRVKKYVCPHCGKRFADSSNFSKHVKSHGDARQFKCQLCGKDFRQKAHLKNHMNTHMPVKNEQCGFCGERFTRSFTRKQHELQHTKQNKIQCAHCDKVFYKQKVYRHHLKIHRNERNYICQHCNKAFRTKGDLTRHGPACKQRKCRIMPLPLSQPALPQRPTPTTPHIQAGDFLHSSNHSDVTMGTYSNDTTKGSSNGL